MIRLLVERLVLILILFLPLANKAQEASQGAVAALLAKATNAITAKPTQTYILSPNDVLLIKVYQEEDLETRLRIGKDGAAAFPLIGSVQIGGKTVEQATALIRERLDKDYIVNPQVTLTVVEYSKRRFTVLGQVQKPGTFEIPNEESVTLLQAIAMAGGYTRLANQSSVTVARNVAGNRTTFSVDARAAANNPQVRPMEIMADDTITVPERIF